MQRRGRGREDADRTVVVSDSDCKACFFLVARRSDRKVFGAAATDSRPFFLLPNKTEFTLIFMYVYASMSVPISWRIGMHYRDCFQP